MVELSKNFASSLVATAPSPATSGTSLTVASGQGSWFPDPAVSNFNAVVCPADARPTPSNAEVVRVTARSTDTFTITRTQESSSARTIIVGDRIYAGVTAKTLFDMAPSMVKVRRTTDDSTFASGTSRAIPFNVEDYDMTPGGSNDQHDNSTNPSRLTVKVAGVYIVSFNLSMDLSGGFGGFVNIRKNGSTMLSRVGMTPDTTITGTVPDSAAVSDYYEVYITNGTGATRGVTVANIEPWFAMHRIGVL